MQKGRLSNDQLLALQRDIELNSRKVVSFLSWQAKCPDDFNGCIADENNGGTTTRSNQKQRPQEPIHFDPTGLKEKLVDITTTKLAKIFALEKEVQRYEGLILPDGSRTSLEPGKCRAKRGFRRRRRASALCAPS